MLKYIPFLICMILCGYGLGRAVKNHVNETDQLLWSVGAITWGLNAKFAFKKANKNND